MTAEVELLPSTEYLRNLPAYCRGRIDAYARACVAHATAAKDAEIDALRTRLEDTVRESTNEIEALRAERMLVIENQAYWKERAELLAEALRDARQMIRDLLPDATFTKWDALLRDHSQEGKDG